MRMVLLLSSFFGPLINRSWMMPDLAMPTIPTEAEFRKELLGCTRAGACGSGRVQGKSSRVDVRCSTRCDGTLSPQARFMLRTWCRIDAPGRARVQGYKADAMRYRVWHEKAKMCVPGDKGHE